ATGYYVITGLSGSTYYSTAAAPTNPGDWTLAASGIGGQSTYESVARGGTVWTVGNDGLIFRTTNGSAWSTVYSAVGFALRSIVDDGVNLVAGGPLSGQARVVYSSTGTNGSWTATNVGATFNLRLFTANGAIIAAGNDGTTRQPFDTGATGAAGPPL